MTDFMIVIGLIEQLYYDGYITEEQYDRLKEYFGLEKRKNAEIPPHCGGGNP